MPDEILLSKRYCKLSLEFRNVEDWLKWTGSVESDFGIINEKTWENKSKQLVIIEGSSKKGTGPRGAVLLDMMRMNSRWKSSNIS
ncbi:hypothetical protein TNCV_3323891 [Trichonephila clavipes]|nr:hypothetical protein TNCV_3323891 [Trichonephila clavipes]